MLYIISNIVIVDPPEDEVLGLILQVSDLADQGTSRPGEDSDRVNSRVRPDIIRMKKRGKNVPQTLFLGREW